MHEFVSQLIALIPEAERAAAEGAIRKAEAQIDAHVAAGVKSGADYNRAMNEAKARADEAALELERAKKWHGDLAGWRQDEERKLRAREQAVVTREQALSAGGGSNGGGQPQPRPQADPDQVPVTAADLDKRERQMAAFMMDMTTLQREHFARFGEILDIGPLLTHEASKQGLPAAYHAVYKDRLEAHEKEAATKREAALKQAGVDEYLKAHPQGPNQLPYPVGGEDTSPLAGLAATDPNAFGVDAAVAFARQVRAGGNGL